MSDNADEKIELDKKLVTELLQSSHAELRRQRRDRYMGLGFKVLLFVGFFVAAYFVGGASIGSGKGDKHKPHVAFVEVYGPIMSGQLADADRLIPALHEAFNSPLSKAVAIRINSPGGSPVHAGRMYSEINELKAQFPDKPVYAVIEDLGASAAYYIASSADKIYVDQASMVGSIGVITSSFGFDQLMNKVGVERRVLTAGSNKGLMDPYLPLDPKIEGYWKNMLAEIHEQFIQAVKTGRGERLKADTPEIFSGLVWTGAKSVEIGLADQLGSLPTVSRDTIGEVNTVNYTPPPNLFKHFSNQANALVKAWQLEAATPALF